MSSAFDKKTDKVNRREARAEKERREKRKIRIIAVTVIIIFALLVAGALFINSKFVRRTITAITIGGVNFSAAEFDYFYNSAYNEYKEYFTSQLGDYAGEYLPTEGVAHSRQIQDYETGATWADFFTSYTIDQLSELVKYYNAAMAAGYTLPDDVREAIENEIATYRVYAEAYGEPSLDSFLQKYIGINMNEKTMRKVMEFNSIATSYSQHIRDSFTYSNEEIAEYYAENKDNFDSFTYRYFLVNAETVTQGDLSDEEYEAAQAAALADAVEQAALIAEGIQSEEDFIKAAVEYNEVDYADPDSTLKVYPGSWLGSVYGPWLQDARRVNGDIETMEMTSGAYVVFFVNRDANEYYMTEMNQLLVMREEVDADEYIDEYIDEHIDENINDYLDEVGDLAYLEAVANADQEAKERAETALSLFIEGGATKEKLIELMEEYSDDTTQDGFYNMITKNAANNKMVPEIEGWLFTPGRQVGDYELIKTEAYGYHLVYFSGYGERYCDYLATDGMRSKDYTAWTESLEDVEATSKWAFIFTTF